MAGQQKSWHQWSCSPRPATGPHGCRCAMQVTASRISSEMHPAPSPSSRPSCTRREWSSLMVLTQPSTSACLPSQSMFRAPVTLREAPKPTSSGSLGSQCTRRTPRTGLLTSSAGDARASEPSCVLTSSSSTTSIFRASKHLEVSAAGDMCASFEPIKVAGRTRRSVSCALDCSSAAASLPSVGSLPQPLLARARLLCSGASGSRRNSACRPEALLALHPMP
mmetsp:Transcript_129810/g.361704  ORF Transcript_129810/g.361704 Transcript_129810/m.361704 type:complete len:222 (+) Transcript_129810:146-811(+)